MCPLYKPSRFLVAAACAALACLQSATAGPIRIVTYNIRADSGGATTVGPGFTTVMQGIANESVNGLARPVDILSLQETTSNSATVAPIVTALNGLWPNTYAMSPYQGTQNGSPTSGNGPNAMVYNSVTLQLIASVGIGTPSTSGFPRQPIRYQFRPVGGDASFDFYVYDSHMKSGTASSDLNRRNIEAQALRSDESTNLPAAARVIYTGDFNWGASTEAAYVTLAASGQGQAFDPINRPGTWELNSAFKDILTESATNLRYRDDCQLVTQNIMNDPSGIQYIAGSYHTFGVDGSTPVNGTVNSGSNTALPGLPNRSAVLSSLTTATDHLPMVADYNITLGQPAAIDHQPVAQTACAGGAAAFSVTATGNPAPTYQWRRGITNLTNSGDFSGVNSPTLSVSPAGLADAALNYNCLVTNNLASVASNDASLTVFPSGSGDGDATGLTNGDDVAGFVNSLISGGSPGPGYCAYDMNSDGQVDLNDLDLFIARLLS